MIREALSAVARNEALGPLLQRTPVARDVVKRVIGGESVDEALAVAAELADRGFLVSLERAAPHVTSREEAEVVRDDYALLLQSIAEAGLSGACEIAVFPDALGSRDDRFPDAPFDLLAELARSAAASRVPLMVGSGLEADRTLEWVEALHEEGLDVGVTLAAARRRTEADCVRLAARRVRLVKGGHRDDPGAFQQPIEIDKAFVRCAKALMRGSGEPSFATHDPRLIEIVGTLSARYGRAPHTFEYAFFLGRQEGAQERLLAEGERVRIYVPYGPEWFERLVGGLAEQSSTVGAALRSLLPG